MSHRSAEPADVCGVPAQVPPLVEALRQRAAAIQAGELARARRRLGPLGAAQERAVEALLSAIVDQVLEAPRVALEQLEQEGLGEPELLTVRTVFGLA